MPCCASSSGDRCYRMTILFASSGIMLTLPAAKSRINALLVVAARRGNENSKWYLAASNRHLRMWRKRHSMTKNKRAADSIEGEASCPGEHRPAESGNPEIKMVAVITASIAPCPENHGRRNARGRRANRNSAYRLTARRKPYHETCSKGFACGRRRPGIPCGPIIRARHAASLKRTAQGGARRPHEISGGDGGVLARQLAAGEVTVRRVAPWPQRAAACRCLCDIRVRHVFDVCHRLFAQNGTESFIMSRDRRTIENVI